MSLTRQALEIRQQVLTPGSALIGQIFQELSVTYLEMGDDARAEDALRQAENNYQHLGGLVLWPEAATLPIRARLSLSMGQIQKARNALKDLTATSESRLGTMLAFGSEQDKLNFLGVFGDETNRVLSLHARHAPNDPEALRLAFTTVLQRKGRALDEMNRSIGLLRRIAGSESAPLFDQLMAKQAERSRLATSASMDETPDRIQRLAREIEELQAAISARSVEYRAQTLPPVQIDDLRAALPQNTALIEFARYHPEDARTKKKAAPRYIAYVLPKEGAVQWVELGRAAEIDAKIRAFRQTLIAPGAIVRQRVAARKLDQLVMRPLRSLLGPTRQLFLSPEGDLNLVPFAALRDERGRYLVEDYLFIYLTSGRDLLRLRIKHQCEPDELIFAISTFDEAAAGTMAEAVSEHSSSDRRGNRLSVNASMATMRFPPLRHAAFEGKAVLGVRPHARLHLDSQATESILKQVRRPKLLHIVTHGFFLPEGARRSENPLLHSGLAMAGANQRQSGADDGILTAYEAAALDLWGTRLVVLSACETGVGEVKAGEGVFGLRRALVLAGAETQLISLWQVNDRATGGLMASYYEKLRDGVGRAEALRQVQLEMLKDRALRNPYFWACFITLGDWTGLN